MDEKGAGGLMKKRIYSMKGSPPNTSVMIQASRHIRFRAFGRWFNLVVGERVTKKEAKEARRIEREELAASMSWSAAIKRLMDEDDYDLWPNPEKALSGILSVRRQDASWLKLETWKNDPVLEAVLALPDLVWCP